jgi:hypothetical protein
MSSTFWSTISSATIVESLWLCLACSCINSLHIAPHPLGCHCVETPYQAPNTLARLTATTLQFEQTHWLDPLNPPSFRDCAQADTAQHCLQLICERSQQGWGMRIHQDPWHPLQASKTQRRHPSCSHTCICSANSPNSGSAKGSYPQGLTWMLMVRAQAPGKR